MFGNLFRKIKEDFATDSTADTERVNCRNLVLATTQVPRLHCDMGDGREGDCLIYLKKAKFCQAHDPKYVALPKEAIEKKVSRLKADKAYRDSCLDVNVCPDCGHDLKTNDWGESEFSDGICRICQKTFILD